MQPEHRTEIKVLDYGRRRGRRTPAWLRGWGGPVLLALLVLLLGSLAIFLWFEALLPDSFLTGL